MKQSETKGRLVKTEEGYNLHIIGHALESLPAACFPWDITKSQLSKQNCDEIFGAIDVEKLTDDFVKDLNVSNKVKHDVQFGYQEGLIKVMELMKDKVFTLEQLEMAFNSNPNNYSGFGLPFNNFLSTIQQPKEIKVIVVEEDSKIKSDENGCLILRKDVS